MHRLALAAAATAALVPAMGFLPQFGSATRRLDQVATVAIPRKARLDDPHRFAERATWVGFRLSRVHTWAMGSSTPYRANLFIAIHAPGAPSSSYDEALKAATSELNGGAQDWKQIERGAQWDVGAGRYTVNMLDEPTWRLAYRDPARRVSVLWQVYQKDWSLADARGAIVRMAESLRVLTEPDYADIADRPRRAAEEARRKHDAALAFLAARGFAPLASGHPLTRDGITVEYMDTPERRVMLYKPVAAAPAPHALPPWLSHGQSVWADTGWEHRMSSHDYYPMPGTRALLARTLAKPGPHHFVVRTIRMDEVEERDYHLADFFTIVARLR
jgi:hypothetical protein